ncbi:MULTISPECIES: hypothetical protein [unclassified Micromonospora]|uniref:hypothetical protein n=1 Tax=unclassified Micromonospora TaxID=2617518 RepID=UPI0010518915|nr:MULTISPECIES: hypothetical protein [unclassified Micromonospora]TDB69483.1 hypothetical protein E1182_29795 [Micromonospora sp. KC721]TDC31674.1 hypothetical protein E1166_27650 [Micromonospora sp. KC213]
MEQRLTDEELSVLKTGAFGAVYLVSNADPGIFAMIRESFAASGVLGATSGVVRTALTTGPLPRLPQESPAAIESVVLPALRRGIDVLRAKSPDEVAVYQDVVLAAADRVARADGGVSPAEAAAIAHIRAALSTPS